MGAQRESRWIGLLVWAGLIVFLITLTVLSFFLYRVAYPLKVPSLLEIEFADRTAELFSDSSHQWTKLERGSLIGIDDRLRTAAGGEIHLSIPKKLHLRIKENSELVVRGPKKVDRQTVPQIELVKGVLLGATETKSKNESLARVKTSEIHFDVQEAFFSLGRNDEKKSSEVGVLRGRLKVEAGNILSPERLVLGSLQKIGAQGKTISSPTSLSSQEWVQMKEVYELIEKTASSEAVQMELSGQAGNFFQHVFDHGTFYSPKIGYAEREFVKNEDGSVYLQINYDVFPAGALVGVYLKTRDFDLSKFETFEYEVRRTPDDHFPDGFRLEFKTGRGIGRAFQPKGFEPDWKKLSMPLNAGISMMTTEVTFVFTHETVGPDKAGALQFRNFNLVPRSQPIKKTKTEASPTLDVSSGGPKA